MTVSTLEFARELRHLCDPDRPTPGRAAHTAVYARAQQIRRRHRATAALATVSCAGLLVTGALAVADTGTPTRERVETAAAPPSGTALPSGAAPTVVDAAVPASIAPTAAQGDGPAQGAIAASGAMSSDPVDPPAASTTAHITVAVSEANVPADVDLEATLTGDGGTFSAHLRTPGTLSFADVPAGDYQLRWSWFSDDGTAQAAGRVPVHVDPGQVSLSV